jgi:uncharacterized protein YlaI
MSSSVRPIDSGERERPANPEYDEYLKSERWKTLRRAVQLRAKNKCEICRRANGCDCAHLTYERIFNEPMSDLLWTCRACHRELDEERKRVREAKPVQG